MNGSGYQCRLIRLLYYLPMERMINLARALDDERLIEKIEQLEKENKNLRDYADNLDSENDNQAIEIEELKKENKNLTKCNLNLQEWLDNKEKVNKSLREENEKLKKYYDRDKEELMESCYDLARENNKLKKDVDYRHHRAMVAERG